MIKHVCDICGKDAVYDDLILPIRNEHVTFRRGMKFYYTDIKPNSADLCFECMREIADLIDDMRV